MNIHETFGKKDLVKVIIENDIDIDISLNKKQLINELLKLDDIPVILKEVNKNKALSIKDKNDIILRSKKIISFCKNGNNFHRSFFNNKEEIIEEIEQLIKYGDISSVRRATKLINEAYNWKYVCTISPEIKTFLDTKKEIKKLGTPNLQIKWGTFKVDF